MIICTDGILASEKDLQILTDEEIKSVAIASPALKSQLMYDLTVRILLITR